MKAKYQAMYSTFFIRKENVSNGNKRGIKRNQPVPRNALFRRLVKALKQILFHSYGIN